MTTTKPPQRIAKDIDRLTREVGAMERGGIQVSASAAPAFRRILVALDGSPQARHALAWARDIGAHTRGRVTAVTAVTPPDMVEKYLDYLGSLMARGESAHLEEEEREARERLEGAVADLEKGGVRASSTLVHGPAVREIVRVAEAERADLVVLGSHGTGALERELLGSVADGVKNHTSASVLLARTMPPPGRVLIATDGSTRSKRAAIAGLRVAQAWRAPSTVLYVFPPLMYGALHRFSSVYENAFGGLVPSWTEPRVDFDVEFGPPAASIADTAHSLGAGLVVLGSRGLSGMKSLVAGSVSNRVAHTAGASVLLVKGVPR